MRSDYARCADCGDLRHTDDLTQGSCAPCVSADLVELHGGQFVLSADVEERGQLVIEELARPPIPAPLNHTPEHPAAALAELWHPARPCDAPGCYCHEEG